LEIERELEESGTQSTISDVVAPSIWTEQQRQQHGSSNNKASSSQYHHGKSHVRFDSFVSIRSDISETTFETPRKAADGGCALHSPIGASTTGSAPRFPADSCGGSRSSVVTPEDARRGIGGNCSPGEKAAATAVVADRGGSGAAYSPTPHRRTPPPPKPLAKQQQHRSSPAPASLTNRFASFLAPRPIPNYNLKMTQPCNIQFVDLALGTAKSNSNTAASSSSSSSPRSLDSEQILNQSTVAFAVCGLEGFDSAANMKPTVGARLIKIQGKTIDDQWTVGKLYGTLNRDANKTTTRTKNIVLTFRNEKWDALQTKVLNDAVYNNKVASPTLSPGTGSRNTSNRHNNHQRVNSFESEQTSSSDGGSVRSDHFQRVRTASTDSVGKAINGFGYFLQNLTTEGGDC